MSRRSIVVRAFAAVAMLALLCGMSWADIPNPEVFRHGDNSLSATLSISTSAKNSLDFEMRLNSKGSYRYELRELDRSNGHGKPLKSESGSVNDDRRHTVRDTFTFAKPHRGNSITYVLEASFTPMTSRSRTRMRGQSYSRLITVSNVEGTVYVFVNEAD